MKGKSKLGDANGSKEQQIEKRICVSNLADLRAKRIASCSLVAKPPHLPTYLLFSSTLGYLYVWVVVASLSYGMCMSYNDSWKWTLMSVQFPSFQALCERV